MSKAEARSLLVKLVTEGDQRIPKCHREESQNQRPVHAELAKSQSWRIFSVSATRDDPYIPFAPPRDGFHDILIALNGSRCHPDAASSNSPVKGELGAGDYLIQGRRLF